MEIKGFKTKDGSIHKYDYNALVNKPDSGQNVELDATLTQRGKAADAKAVGDKIAEITGVSLIEPADGDTPLVFFTGAKPTTKDNVLAEMVYISKGKSIKAYVKIKCQGSSSMSYAKKNFTVTLYQDEARTIPLYLEFKDWGIKVNKFVLKADWIDHSHSRNVCTARIWKDIVESRPDYDNLPTELKNAPGHGAIVGFPIAVYYNGNYEGLYNWNIGKDPWMWGMDENNSNHAMLCAEVNNEGKGTATMCNFQGPLWGGVDGTGWSVEIGTNSTALKNSLNSLITFVANSDEETFVNGIEEYLDVQSGMDYYCLCYADCGLDGLGKNMTIGTYDGKKWYFGAYDLDCTWLLYWNGSKFVPATYRCPEDYQENANLLFDKFERYMTARLRTNYQRLRSGPLAEANVMRHFEWYIGGIGQERYADDLVAYPGIPQGTTNNIRQIRSAVRDRLAFTDAEFAAMFDPVPCTGISLDKPSLTFTAEGTQTLTASVAPDGCTDPVTWESDNASVATVENGVVTAIANGSATITAKCGEFSANCTVSVSGIAEPIPCTGISLDKTELSFTGEGAQTITATVTPADTTDAVVWSSDNEAVATVKDGVVTAVFNGNATVTATCGTQTAECSVTVSGIDIPMGYEKLSYIQSSGTQYIDTSVADSSCIVPLTKGGGIEDSTGNVSVADNGSYTEEYVAIPENATGLYISCAGDDWHSTAFYDSKKTYLSSIAGKTTSTITIPDGASFVRTAVYNSPATNVVLDFGTSDVTAAYEIKFDSLGTTAIAWEQYLCGAKDSTIPKINDSTWQNIGIVANWGSTTKLLTEQAAGANVYKYNADGTFEFNGENLIADTGTAGNGWGKETWYVCNSHGEPTLMASMKLYYLKMWTDGQLVRDFRPVKRADDGVIGLYDCVSGVFFTNAGTGVFTGE